jgi:hypothetical protein
MTKWLVLQLILLVGWSVAIFYLYQRKLWKARFPFNANQVFKALFLIVLPICWQGSSLVLGLGLLVTNASAVISPSFLFLLIILPIISLTLTAIWLILRYRSELIENSNHQNAIMQKVSECKQWIQKFEFINNQMIDVKIYISNGKPVGKLIVHDVTKDQAKLITEDKQGPPKDVYLEVIAKDHSDDTFYH